MANYQSDKNTDYTGMENLEVMLEAVNYNKYLKSLIKTHAAGAERVLDFGAGLGTFSGSTELPMESVHCVELDDKSRQSLKDQGFNAYADLSEVEGQFDYIFTLNVLEHIEDDEAITKQLFEKLRPGGVLFAFVPAFEMIWTSLDDLVGHHRRYTIDSLRHICLTAGFKIEDIRYADFGGFFAALLYKTMDRFKQNPDGQLNTRAVVLYDRVAFPLSRLLSVPFGKIVGKNVYVVASKPA